MLDKQPIRWKVVILINAAMLGGFILSAFIVPPSTRLSVFLYSCLAIFVGFNTYLYFQGYRRRQPKASEGLNQKQPGDVRFWRWVLTAIAWIVILWQVVHRYWLK